MPILGSHLSIAGGYHKAVYQAAGYGMGTVQIFTKNNNQWQGKPLLEEEIERFREAVQETGLQSPCAHDSYLINIGNPDREKWQKSVDALLVELQRAEALGLAGVVMHPGSFLDDTPEAALTRIAQGIDEVHAQTEGFACELWLETTAGQGTNLGHRFEHLQAILDQVQAPERLGICVDTCHIFAAGYPLQTAEEYQATFDEFDRLIGTQRIRSFHLNDSKKPLGSRVDRHEHIGEGELGDEPFRHLLNDPRFAEHPMYLETKKEVRDGQDMDVVNLNRLRGLMTQ